MLQIRLSRGTSAESGGGTRSLPVETVTVTCPDHLVLADLPVAKSLGSVTAASLVKSIGRRSRRHLGERVHFCVRCDFPIAIYGRLSPCEHVFCLDCARSDSICYLCDERIQKIQTIKMMEGIFICAAPHCLKSFLKRTQFESHIHAHHSNLFHADSEKEDGNESEAQSFRHPAASESSAKAQQRQAQAHSPSAQSLPQDRDDKACRQLHWEPSLPRPAIQSRPSPLFGPGKNIPPDQQVDSCPPGFEGTMPSDAQFVDLSPRPFVIPGHSLNPPFGYAPFPDGIQSFYGAPNEMTMGRPDAGPDQGSLLGFPPGLDLLGGPVGGDYGRDMAMERQSSSLLPLPLSVKRGQSYGGKMDDDGQGFGWEGHRYC